MDGKENLHEEALKIMAEAEREHSLKVVKAGLRAAKALREELEEKRNEKERKTSDPNYKYTKKYDAANTIKVSLKLNINTDADIIEYLNSVDNKQGTIKTLIRREIEKSQGF